MPRPNAAGPGGGWPMPAPNAATFCAALKSPTAAKFPTWGRSLTSGGKIPGPKRQE
jgi:hypothetical protein